MSSCSSSVLSQCIAESEYEAHSVCGNDACDNVQDVQYNPNMAGGPRNKSLAFMTPDTCSQGLWNFLLVVRIVQTFYPHVGLLRPARPLRSQEMSIIDAIRTE